MGPFYGKGSTVPRSRRDSLLFATKYPGSPGTHLIDLGRMKS